MKFADRYAVEGTYPVIYIGRRVQLRKGQERVGRRYYAEWSFEGQGLTHALKTTNKEVAIRKAHDICRRIGEGEARPRVWKCTIHELVEQYLQLKLDEGLARKSIEKYQNDLTHFRDWAREAGVHSAITFDVREFWRFGKVQREAGYHDKTVYSRMILVKQLFKWGWENKLVPDYTLRPAKLAEPDPTDQPCFSAEQVAKLLSLAEPAEAAVLATLAYAGLRIGEARELRWEDVLWDVGSHGFFVIRRGGSNNQTKNKKVRRIPIHAHLRRYLEGIPRTHEHVFVKPDTGRSSKAGLQIAERQLLVRLKRLCRRAGLERPQRFKLHTFRHAFASMCARTNVSYKYALDWMGHSSSDILDHYYSMYDDVAERAMATIDYSTC